MFKLYNKTQGYTGAAEERVRVMENAYFRGQALVLKEGALVAATGSDKPHYLCLADRQANAGAGTVPVLSVTDNQRYETTAVTGAELEEGDCVTLSNDGMQVTGTKENGVFTITHVNGDTVVGLFK
ncbi:MAG: hypothetical protein IJP30_04280 [Clostridia bacterium]|nr:hypothetical protein [Clostridia bacterium]